MKNTLAGATLLVLASASTAEPVVYTDEALFLAGLAALGIAAIHESFEDDAVWAESRNSIPEPGSTATVTSQGIRWTSNYAQNEIATGDVGGSAPDGTYAIYSLPHGLTDDSGLYCDNAEDPIPVECFQNDGLKVESAAGDALYAFGGRIDTANSGKVSFLLDGVDINGNDSDNIDNWQREGEWADGWAFVGVIDTDGFQTAELRELRGKDFQQVLLFADDFSVGVRTAPVSVAGSVAGMYLGYAYCIDLNTNDIGLDLTLGTSTNWNCTDNGLSTASGDAVIAFMAGAGSYGSASVRGSIAGIAPVFAVCVNNTTGLQAVVPLAGSSYWDCAPAGFASRFADKVSVFLYGIVP